MCSVTKSTEFCAKWGVSRVWYFREYADTYLLGQAVTPGNRQLNLETKSKEVNNNHKIKGRSPERADNVTKSPSSVTRIVRLLRKQISTLAHPALTNLGQDRNHKTTIMRNIRAGNHGNFQTTSNGVGKGRVKRWVHRVTPGSPRSYTRIYRAKKWKLKLCWVIFCDLTAATKKQCYKKSDSISRCYWILMNLLKNKPN